MMAPRELRAQVEAIMAEAEAVQWDESAKGGPAAAERLVEDRVAKLVQANADLAVMKAEASRPRGRPVTIQCEALPMPRDLDAERHVLKFLLIRQPGPPTNWPTDLDEVTPAWIRERIGAAAFSDPFHAWLFDAIADARRTEVWTTHLLARREETATLTSNLALDLKRIGCHEGFWHWTAWNIGRVIAAANRRTEIANHLDALANIIQEQRNANG